MGQRRRVVSEIGMDANVVLGSVDLQLGNFSVAK